MFLKNKHIIIGLLLVLTVRVGYVLLIKYHEANPVLNKLFKTFAPKALRNAEAGKIIESDAIYYDFLAKQLVSGQGLTIPKQDVIVAPGYPCFLGILYYLFGTSIIISLLAESFLDTLTAFIMILLIRQLFKHEIKKRIELLFLIIFSFYIPYVVHVVAIATEGLFTCLLILFAFLYTKYQEEKTIKWLIFSGIVLGLASLTRPITLILPVWLLFWNLLFPQQELRKQILKQYIILSVFLSLTVMPWTIRNYYLYNKIIIVNSNANLAVIGTDTKTSAGEFKKDISRDSLMKNFREKHNIGVLSVYSEIILNIVKHPIDYIKLFGNKFIRLWFNLGFEGKASPGSVITGVVQGILLILFIISFITKDTRKRLLLLNHSVLYVSFFHVVFFTAKIRFLVPFMPFLLLISIIVFVYLIRNKKLKNYFAINKF